ncbi:hypothetical protein JQ616_03185 [Bradyrhizobium tropiciagri]|uniref:hypothetical protein n=1 Tax=Bradyrhizobium tropiciagri TaxID=312253 RepID=UPI001BADC43D|nr:hypothetical protein [Bradyrhizobium tropiciagri]MBR0893939.1 hypothetical protein [Bradyrhizobium tropiciagri]
MDQTSHSGITSAMKLQALIADLNWKIQLLNSDIAEENLSGASRSTLALHLKSRHHNLLTTVALLEKQLASIGSLVPVARPASQGMHRKLRSSATAALSHKGRRPYPVARTTTTTTIVSAMAMNPARAVQS